VPRYQNLIRIFVWLAFLAIYSQAVREPLDRVNPSHSQFDPFEIGLYFLALSFCIEGDFFFDLFVVECRFLTPFIDAHKLFKLLQLIDPRQFSFWVSFGQSCLEPLLTCQFTAGCFYTYRLPAANCIFIPRIWHLASAWQRHCLSTTGVPNLELCLSTHLVRLSFAFRLIPHLKFCQDEYVLIISHLSDH
jgi:hypothetical protein